ncbi:SusC/RagA family TonB-linked outer membrane protein [Hymenobacter psychrophilus]|uniref:TonB-linked outer membrane protein, SusC/RagA family n=1 Tax=Hymenobacter psychrophilus TaxID=651662 RepID=A0A1H3FPZ5_9BACT|nr:SusC/RagA family TonB-linked outer membrane protein [Hymenobacter psychrophilus]SDX92214.1 TonB-linked outer membrane protein, SusC/RagA family [Hymenobacter psychrophilus]
MRKVLLTAALFAPVLLQQAAAQDRQISGRVTDRASGQGLPGVTVLVKGTTIGVSTNADGTYTISAPSSATTLTFSSIGFVSLERPIGTASTVDVGLSTDSKVLNEVVVTAVGIERQEKSLAYAVDVINNKSLTQGKETNPIASLQGKVAGANISSSSGGVNSSKRIVLRGNRSFQGENQPVFVVDGIIINNSNIQPSTGTINQVDTGNRVGDINPEDIETMTILKGPSAAALYGSVAANGAIIITTKSGKNAAELGKKAQISYSSSFVAETPLKLPDFQNEYGSGFDNEFYPEENTNWGPRFDGSEVQYGFTLPDGSKNIQRYEAKPNNVRDFFNTGTTFLNTLSLQGGNAKTNYYLSFSDAVQKGIVPDDKFRRNNLKLTAATTVAEKLTASTSIAYNHNFTDVTFQGSGIIDDLYNVSRGINTPDYKDINSPFGSKEGFFSGYYYNPYQSINDDRFESKLDRIIGNVTLNYAPVEWFNLTYRVGSDYSYDRRNGRNAIKVGTTAYTRPTDDPGRYNETRIFLQDFTTDLLGTFRKNVTPDLSVQLILGGNVRASEQNTLSTTANALVLPNFFNLANRSGEAATDTEIFRRRLIGAYGDLTVTFRDYLTLTATGRNDWSSTLPKNSRSYFYPSVGLAFVFTDAIPVLKDNNTLTYGKIRASYAKVGNDATPYYLQNTFPVAAGFPFGGQTGFTVSNRAANDQLKLEQITSFEAGIELGLLNDRVNGQVTYYTTTSTDLISSLAVPPSTGFTSAILNIGEVYNNGLETTLRITPVKLDNGFRWDIGANFTIQDSEVKKLFGNARELAAGAGNPVPTFIIGEPSPVLKGTAFLRDPAGNIVVRPTVASNGDILGYDPVADPVQRILGRVSPKYLWGGNTTFSYKGLRATVVVDAKVGASIYSGTKSTLAFTGSSAETAEYNREAFVYPNSVVENVDGNGNVTYSPNTNVTSDGGFGLWYSRLSNPIAEFNIISADFLKLREASITYDLPQGLLQNTFLGRASVGFSGRNLLLFVPKENKFIDPEASIFGTGNSQGREFGTIPTTRSYGVNLSVTF